MSPYLIALAFGGVGLLVGVLVGVLLAEFALAPHVVGLRRAEYERGFMAGQMNVYARRASSVEAVDEVRRIRALGGGK